jgi:hypothetical protein
VTGPSHRLRDCFPARGRPRFRSSAEVQNFLANCGNLLHKITAIYATLIISGKKRTARIPPDSGRSFSSRRKHAEIDRIFAAFWPQIRNLYFSDNYRKMMDLSCGNHEKSQKFLHSHTESVIL